MEDYYPEDYEALSDDSDDAYAEADSDSLEDVEVRLCGNPLDTFSALRSFFQIKFPKLFPDFELKYGNTRIIMIS
jgi:hypothetical protein